MGEIIARNKLSWLELLHNKLHINYYVRNKPLLLHLVGCLYYLYQWCTFKQMSKRGKKHFLQKYIVTPSQTLFFPQRWIKKKKDYKLFHGWNYTFAASAISLFISVHKTSGWWKTCEQFCWNHRLKTNHIIQNLSINIVNDQLEAQFF